MTMTRSAEYDAFGPWIFPVAAAEQVPRAFRDHPFDFDGAESILKLPRDIARRDATPDMHLYDRMLVVDHAGLTVLTRVGDGFDVATMRAEAIGAIEHSAELLTGALTIHGTDGSRIEIPFNSVSTGLIVGLARRLADLAGAASDDSRPSDRMQIDALGVADVAVAGAYREAAAATRGLRVRAAYGASAPASKESLSVRLIKGRAHLSAAVICDTPSQLLVLSRRTWLRYRGKPDLSTRQTLIVRSRITGITMHDSPLVRDVTSVTVAFGAGGVVFEVPTPGDAVAALSTS